MCSRSNREDRRRRIASSVWTICVWVILVNRKIEEAQVDPMLPKTTLHSPTILFTSQTSIQICRPSPQSIHSFKRGMILRRMLQPVTLGAPREGQEVTYPRWCLLPRTTKEKGIETPSATSWRESTHKRKIKISTRSTLSKRSTSWGREMQS